MKRLTREEVIERAKQVHGDKYNYDEFVFCGNKTKSTIICPKHGRFEQSMEVHVGGHGCPECGKEERNRKLCEEHGIKLLYFSDKQYEDNVITNENKLLEEINKL